MDINLLREEEGYTPVPGCMATVKINVNVDPTADTVKISGVADSRVALGMLAVISQVRFYILNLLPIFAELHFPLSSFL